MPEEKNEGFIQALETIVPATGCTEPIAVAYATAVCVKELKLHQSPEEIQKIEVFASPNVLKNAMAVIVPGTGEPGLKIAAAAGAIAGDAAQELKVIEKLQKEELPDIKALARSGKVRVALAEVLDSLYVEVRLHTDEELAIVKIAGGHTNIFSIQKNHQVVFEKERPSAVTKSEVADFLRQQNLKSIWDFAVTEELSKIAFIKEAKTLNMRLAEDGLKHQYGIRLGRTLGRVQENSPELKGDLDQRTIALTVAASDARMGGASLAAMTNSGSGNQGITATVPVCVVAADLGVDEEHLIRALALSHLVALHIHAFLPVLSAYCATDSAAMGAAAGIIYLRTGNYDQMTMAINNMAGDATGMICDGAGCACAMKVSNSVSSLCRAVNLALAGIVIPSSNGIVCENADETIHGLGRFVWEGMKASDPVILDIMMNKGN